MNGRLNNEKTENFGFWMRLPNVSFQNKKEVLFIRKNNVLSGLSVRLIAASALKCRPMCTRLHVVHSSAVNCLEFPRHSNEAMG
jgi:hypothetical protein